MTTSTKMIYFTMLFALPAKSTGSPSPTRSPSPSSPQTGFTVPKPVKLPAVQPSVQPKPRGWGPSTQLSSQSKAPPKLVTIGTKPKRREPLKTQ